MYKGYDHELVHEHGVDSVLIRKFNSRSLEAGRKGPVPDVNLCLYELLLHAPLNLAETMLVKSLAALQHSCETI